MAEGAGVPGNPESPDQLTPVLPPRGQDGALPADDPTAGGSSGDTPGLPAQPPPQLTGRKLGQYMVLEKIGQGGMGSVFRAFDTLLERVIALKVLFSSPVDDPKLAERFLREARSLARLNHPSLLHIYNVGREGDCYYFAMELLEGETLSAALGRRGNLPEAELLHYAGQILSALHYVHLQGITHRDVKSGNIMLCGTRAVLMDFGLARDEANAGLTSVGVILGTPDYMPPETAQGIPTGPPSDIYSFGVVMYEALSGSLPFSGRSAMSIIRQHLDNAPPPLIKAAPDIEPQFAAIVHKCLFKDPAERYHHCPALALDLVKVHHTPELEALAVQKPDFSTRPSQKHSVNLAALQAAREATLTAAPGRQDAFDATVLETGQPISARPADLTVLKTGTPVKSPGPDMAPTVPSSPRPEVRLRMESAPAEQPAASWRAWVWVGAGFFGVLLLVGLLSSLGRGRPQVAPVPPGQAAILHKADGSPDEEIRWIEFKAGSSDPSQWEHSIARRQPDGTWARLSVKHRDVVRDGVTLEFPSGSGGVAKKP